MLRNTKYIKTFQLLLPYLWPKERKDLRLRVSFAVVALVLAKIASVCTPLVLGEREMDWIVDLYKTLEPNDINYRGCVTGKSVESGGIRGRAEATGRGVQEVIREFFRHPDLIQQYQLKPNLENNSIVIQGFGNVGLHLARTLYERDDAKIIAIGEHNGYLYNPKGIDIQKLIDYKTQNKSVDCKELDTFFLTVQIAYAVSF